MNANKSFIVVKGLLIMSAVVNVNKMLINGFWSGCSIGLFPDGDGCENVFYQFLTVSKGDLHEHTDSCQSWLLHGSDFGVFSSVYFCAPTRI